MKIFQKLFFFISALFLSSYSNAEKITVFAAASMTDVLQEIRTQFEKKYPEDKIVFSFASSSVLAKQIEQDAPADLFLSADLKWLDYLQQKQPNKIHQRLNLLQNELVLIAPKTSHLEATDSIQAVKFSEILANNYLSVGDPSHVPAGQYAQKALSYYGLWSEIEPRLARAKNVRDALTFVEREEAPLGIVYSTDAKAANAKVKVIATFPKESYGEIVYPMARLTDSALSKKFFDYLTSDEVKETFKSAGFTPVF